MPRMLTAVSGPNRQPAIVCASSVFRDPDRENSVQAEIMSDPVTPTIPAGALPTMQSRREREYPHAKEDGPGRLGSELYIYNCWHMQWGLHPGKPPI